MGGCQVTASQSAQNDTSAATAMTIMKFWSEPPEVIIAYTLMVAILFMMKTPRAMLQAAAPATMSPVVVVTSGLM